jgi:DNA-binding GntR family transcriptional regulator
MRNNLATDIADQARRLIVEGRLAPGQRLNEGRLAAQLDVSRTPLREALAQLASEGFVNVKPRRGFFVQSPDADEIRELYQIRGILDPAALELAGLPTPAQLGRLAALNTRILDAVSDVDAIIRCDDAWHVELLSHCPNRVVLDLIRHFMLRTRPLERA